MRAGTGLAPQGMRICALRPSNRARCRHAEASLCAAHLLQTPGVGEPARVGVARVGGARDFESGGGHGVVRPPRVRHQHLSSMRTCHVAYCEAVPSFQAGRGRPPALAGFGEDSPCRGPCALNPL